MKSPDLLYNMDPNWFSWSMSS